MTQITAQMKTTGHVGALSFSQPVTAVLVAAFTVVLLFVTNRSIGLTWDEPVYMEASRSYIAWYNLLARDPVNALQSQSIQQYWQLNHEHPPFDKVWSGAFWAATRNWLDDITAHRLGNILLSGVLSGVLFLLVGGEYGTLAGLGAVAALLGMPRFFFHSHLAALDVPTTATILLTCYVFWAALERPGLKWSLLLGVVYWIAISTKINGLFEIPSILFLWVVIFQRKMSTFQRLVIMVVTGVLLWFIFWPWLYHDTVNRLVEYIQFLTVNHYHIAQWYHGRMYLPPPWHYPFVMTLAVTPLALTLLAGIGIGRILSRRLADKLGWLLIFFALFPILLLAARLTQAFDDERLLMPAFPFIAAFAGIGFSQLVKLIQSAAVRWNRQAWVVPVASLLAIGAIAPQWILAEMVYPHLLSYYSETVGSLPGAVRLGFENTYWADTYAESLSYLNTHATQNATVWVEAHDVMLYYQRIGLLRRDLRIASLRGSEGIVEGVQGYSEPVSQADYAVIEYRQSGFFKDVTDWIQGRTPVFEIRDDGDPLLQIFKR